MSRHSRGLLDAALHTNRPNCPNKSTTYLGSQSHREFHDPLGNMFHDQVLASQTIFFLELGALKV